MAYLFFFPFFVCVRAPREQPTMRRIVPTLVCGAAAVSSRMCHSSSVKSAAAVGPAVLCSPPASSVIHKNPFGFSISQIPTTSFKDKDVIRIRGRLQNSRIKGKVGFLHVRQPPSDSIQVVIGDDQELLALAKTITPESIVDVWGTVVATPNNVNSVSCQRFEVIANKISVVSLAETPLPFPLHDKNTKLETRLDNRIMDLRTPSMGATTRLVSVANNAFRSFLLKQKFVEIHTPKMIGTPSEGGSAIFALDYFDKKAFLAQSPQLYKQMMLMGDAMGVFEIGPVFRAEKSLTHRHLTEFIGLDVEMVIHDNYTEVLNVLEGTLVTIIQALERETELTALATSAMESKPTPIVALLTQETMSKYQIGEHDKGVPSGDRYGAYVSSRDSEFPVLRMNFDNAMQLLVDEKVIACPLDDFSTVQEKQLGQIMKARYGVDVYIVDRFPKSARPFYTMLDPKDDTKTLSYDMYLRGEEICSGAQRLHDPKFLQQRMKECGVDVTLIQDYVNSFKYGAWPHGGFGLGLERIVLFYLGVPDVRMVSLFPRDPKRISP